MKYLCKKMFRDFWAFKVQFIAVLLMAMVSMLIYVGVEGLWFAMQNNGEQWMEDSNTADAWIYGSEIDKKDLEKIRNIKGISDVQGAVEINVSLREPQDNGKILVSAYEKNVISTIKLIDGIEYNAKEDGIWIYEFFAQEHDLSVGDKISIRYEGKDYTLVIKGLVQSSEYMYYSGSASTLLPDRYLYGYGYISLKTINNMRNTENYNQIKINFESNEYTDEEFENIRIDVEEALGVKYAGMADRTQFTGISVVVDAAKSFQSMSITFSAVFILLVLLTINTTIKRMVETQRTQIGTLKAIGYSNKAIRVHYGCYGLLISILGVLLGYFISPPVITKMFIDIELDFYYIPNWTGENSVVSVVLAVIIVICCSITALLACNKGVLGMPSEIMRNEAPAHRKRIFIEGITWFWNPLSYEWKWALRETFRNKGRTFIGIVAICGSFMLLIAGFGMRDSLSNANYVLYGEQFNYGSKIILSSSATLEEKVQLYEEMGRNGQWMQESKIELRNTDYHINSQIQIYDEGYFVHFANLEGKRISLPEDGVVVSNLFANEKELQAGDSIQIRVNGQENFVTVIISDVVDTYAPQGVFASAVYWSKLGQDFWPNIFLAASDNNMEDLSEYTYIDEVTTLGEQLESAEKVVGSMTPIVLMLLAAAVVLSIAILYNLGILNFAEKSREYATQQVLGYHAKDIRKVMCYENIVQLFWGLLIGIPVARIFLKYYVRSVSNSNFEYVPHISAVNICLSYIIIVGCSYLTIRIVSGKIQRLDMVEALKSVE